MSGGDWKKLLGTHKREERARRNIAALEAENRQASAELDAQVLSELRQSVAMLADWDAERDGWRPAVTVLVSTLSDLWTVSAQHTDPETRAVVTALLSRAQDQILTALLQEAA